MEHDTKSKTYPPALERALQIFDYMSVNSTPVSIKDISRILKIPHSSAFRIIKCLADYGYLRKAPSQTERYILGYRLLKIAQINSRQNILNEICLPYMRILADQVSQICQLSVLENNEMVIITQHVLLEDVVIIMAKLGERLPINTCASGKLLYAFLPEEVQEACFPKASGNFKCNTEKTITDPQQFKQQLKRIRRQGYSFDREEYATGIGCFSMPILDFSGEAIAALTLTGSFSYYQDPQSAAKLLSALADACRRISEELGFDGTYPCCP